MQYAKTSHCRPTFAHIYPSDVANHGLILTFLISFSQVVAKAGIDALSAQLAIELGPRGITSNVIAPGPIEGTEGVRRLIQVGDTEETTRKIPLGKFGSLKDMGDAVVYLFSDTGDYVNGNILVGTYELKILPCRIFVP